MLCFVQSLWLEFPELLLTFKLAQEERKILEREVARAKVSANRVATVVANEWKDGNDKVMPVKQWLEERKFFQVLDISVISVIYFVFPSNGSVK